MGPVQGQLQRGRVRVHRHAAHAAQGGREHDADRRRDRPARHPRAAARDGRGLHRARPARRAAGGGGRRVLPVLSVEQLRPRPGAEHHRRAVRRHVAVSAAPAIAAVSGADLAALLPLMRAYCDFYEVAPDDEALLAMSRALIADPEREGVQFVARAESGAAVGFATVFWTWSTTRAARIGVMNDLFVAAEARGAGGGRIGEAPVAAGARRRPADGAGSPAWAAAGRH